MDHDAVVRQKTTERYLLNELGAEARNEFEEHYFDCQECAADVQAGALFVEQAKVVMKADQRPVPAPVRVPVPPKAGWFAWLRPAFAVPVLAALLVVVGYQNLVTVPQLARQLNTPQVPPSVRMNLGTYGGSDTPAITVRPGQGFLLYPRISEKEYAKYAAELYNPAGKLEWSLGIQPSVTGDQYPVYVPGVNRGPGKYNLKVYGVSAAGDHNLIGEASFELQIQK